MDRCSDAAPDQGEGVAGYRIDTDDATHEAEGVDLINLTLRMSVPRGGRFNRERRNVR